jgi:hypothetical protein
MNDDFDLVENTGEPIKCRRPANIHEALFVMLRHRVIEPRRVYIELNKDIELDTLRLISFN